MKTLSLVRHAKAVPRSQGIGDMKRSLVPVGRTDARILARHAKAKGIKPELLLSSPANRTVETAQIFAEEFRYPFESIVLNDAIYDEGELALLDIVRNLDDQYGSVMIFGHNPSLTDFAAILLDDFQEIVPKSGLVCITFKTKQWSRITGGKGKLKEFDAPSPKARKAEALKALGKDVQTILAQEIESALKDINPAAAEKMFKSVLKASKRISKTFVKIVKAEKPKPAAGDKDNGKGAKSIQKGSTSEEGKSAQNRKKLSDKKSFPKSETVV